ncbi:MerR family transcriptional regulator [Prauserella oleivorans]|uniref:MerR family transcriptional regulator n=2 Tax=Prauserella TaxID=142577 RepID=A0A318LIW0_9PSEU|nr:MerR family transcriptional regulator [Prauserella flavalba]PXY25558.1 MerR family transcriptional regulator [Prauserella flavalba]
MTSNGLMTVGELSRRTGVPIKTLRQYTDSGLIYTIGRSPTNYRLFNTDALWCVQLIGQLRGFGLTVAEIRELTRTDSPIGPQLAELLHRSRARLTARIAELQQTLRRIDDFEATHQAALAGQGGQCWLGDPRCAASA